MRRSSSRASWRPSASRSGSRAPAKDKAEKEAEKEKEEAEPAPVAVATGAADSLQLFLADVGRHKLLNAAQEVQLAKLIERGDPSRSGR